MPKSDTQFKSQGVGLDRKIPPLATRLPPEIDAIVRAMPDRSDFIRQAIIEKLQRENLLGEAQ